jgi:hypothetical protein
LKENKLLYFYKLLFFIVTNFCICFSAQASDWWASLEGGAAFMQESHNNTVEPMPGVNLPDNYRNTGSENTGVFGAGIGYEFTRAKAHTWFPSNRLGVFYDYYSPSAVSGQIEKWQTVTAYTYTIDVFSNTLWLGDQLDLFKWSYFTPFIEVGLGIAWNNASNYNERATPNNNDDRDECNGSAAFADHTTTSFAWRAGMGVNLTLPCSSCEHWNVGLLYRYADLGHAKTGASDHYPSVNKGIETELRSNEVLATLQYHF